MWGLQPLFAPTFWTTPGTLPDKDSLRRETQPRLPMSATKARFMFEHPEPVVYHNDCEIDNSLLGHGLPIRHSPGKRTPYRKVIDLAHEACYETLRKFLTDAGDTREFCVILAANSPHNLFHRKLP